MEAIFYMSCVFLLTVFALSMTLAVRGNQTARYFLWIWAALMVLALPWMHRANMISHMAAGLMLLFSLHIFYMTVCHGAARVDVSHEETRRVLAECNRRIDEERRTLARRLHDDVNPHLLLSRNVLKQLEPLLAADQQAVALLANTTTMLNAAYAEIRDIIRNTHIEVIDTIGFTAALESLVTHYTNIVEQPVVTLEHNLPRQLALPDTVDVSLYKIIREAIFNAIKHAHATRVCVRIQQKRNRYTVEVSDDGVGMKATARHGGHTGIGLIDMRERVRVLGGTLTVQAADPAQQKRPGTKISFSFSGQSS